MNQGVSWLQSFGCSSSSQCALPSTMVLHTLPSLLPPGRCNACSPLCRMPLAAVGYLDGTLAIYDLSTQSLRHKCQHEVLPCPLPMGLGGISGPIQDLPWSPGAFLGPVSCLCFSLSPLGFPKSSRSPCSEDVPQSWAMGLALLSVGTATALGGAETCWGSPSADPVASPCPSRGLCSCCGRRTRPWCTPAAWTGPCGFGTPAQGR